MTYCVSDIHGCYEEFMRLLEKLELSDADTLYVLGDIIDRGDAVFECLDFIRSAKNIHCLLGNHEVEMLRYYDGSSFDWLYSGCGNTMSAKRGGESSEKPAVSVPGFPALRLTDTGYWREYVKWISGWLPYLTMKVNGRRYFLSHAGLDPAKTLRKQGLDDFVWSRENFYQSAALEDQICVFGHTPTYYIRGNSNCAVWIDEARRDKICIDCGCVHGGALAALRLEDGKVYYVKALAKKGRRTTLRIERSSKQ